MAAITNLPLHRIADAAPPSLLSRPGSDGRSQIPLPHESWLEAEQALRHAITAPKGIIALLGAPGVGKSLLLTELERGLRAAGQAAEHLDFGDLVTGEEPPGLLLVDEADRIEEDALHRLARREQGVAVLAALPAFAERLLALPHEVVRLGGLRGADIATYVAARLQAQGAAEDSFEPDALAALGLESAGVPRLLNVLIGGSLFAAQLDGSEKVGAEHVRSAAGMHALPASALRWTRPPAEAPAVKPEPSPEIDPEPDPEPVIAAEPIAAPERPMPAKPPVPATPPLPLLLRPEPRIGKASAEGRAGWRLWPWGLAVLLLAGGAAAWFAQDVLPRGGSAPAQDQATVPLAMAAPPAESATNTQGAEQPPRLPGETAAEAAAPPAAQASAPDPAPEEAQTAAGAIDLPVRPPPRLVVTYPRGDRAAAQRGAALASGLRQDGTRVSAPFPVAGGGGEALRYFFLEDRDLARGIAERAGRASAEAQLGTVSAQAPLPRPGTLEWALPAGAAPDATLAPSAPPPAATPGSPPATPEPLAPPSGEVLAALPLPRQVALRWAQSSGHEQPCCFVEVLRRAGAGNAWREVFSGYAAQADRQMLPVGEPGQYAWRVLAVTREGPRYTAGPWSGFVVPAAP